MKHSSTTSQIAAALKQEELGMPLEDVIAQAGISEKTFLRWKKQYGLYPKYVRDMQVLQDENCRLKQIVADLTLEVDRLREEVSRK